MPLNLENIDLGGFGISEEDDTQPDLNNQVRANMDEALKINPDQHAQTSKLSQESGIPEFAVDSDPADVEHKLKLNKIDFTEMSKRNPNTTSYLTDFNKSVIAQDDIDVLQAIEDVFDFGKTFENIGESITTGFSTQGKGLELAGVDMAPERIQDLIPIGSMPAAMMGMESELSTRLAETMGVKTDEELQKVKEESVNTLLTEIRALQEKQQKLTPEDLNLLEEGVRAGIESLGHMAPGTALMLLSGGRAAPLLATMGVQTFGGSFGEGRAEGMAPAEAGWFAGIDTVIEVGSELLPTKTLETIILGKSEGLTKSALKFAIQEMGTEQLATLGQSLNSYAFGLDDEMEQAGSIEEMVQIQLRRQAITAIATVVAGGAQITAATGIRKTVEAVTQSENKKQTQGDIEQQKIDQLNELSEKSKLRERDKESFKQFVEQADGENNTHVFIDGAQTSLYLQDKTREEIEADPALQLLADQAREAAAQGNDVQVPVAEFAAEIAGTEHFEALRDSMTMSDETVSPFRQDQAQQETETYVRSLMEEAQESASEYVEAQEIYTSVRDQLIDTGQVTPANASIMAQIVPAWATAQARRQGKTVTEIYQDAGLTIEGPATGERARLEAEMVLEQEPAYKDAPAIFESARDQFLDVLPEDAEVSEVLETADQLGPEYKNFITQLDKNDWLGFDFPSQAINAALSEELENYEITPGLKQSIGRMVNKAFGVATVEQRATLSEQPGVPTDEQIRRRPEEVDEAVAVEARATQQETIDRAKARTEAEALSEFNRAKAGESVTFTHRSPEDFSQFDDSLLGQNTETPAGNLGHYFSADDVGNQERYGHVLSVHEFIFENPLVIDAEVFADVMSNLTPEEVMERREALMNMGHDGVLVEGLNWAIVFESSSVTKLEEAEVFFQEGQVEVAPAQTVGEGLTSEEFNKSISDAVVSNPNAPSVDVYEPSEYDNHSVFTFDEGKVGFAISPDGMLVSVFKHPDSKIKGALDLIIPEAIKRGATHLEAFEGFLTKSYSKYGFEEYDRVAWDDQYKPEGWTDEMGTPSVVFMRLDNDKFKEYTTTTGEIEIQDLRGIQRSVEPISDIGETFEQRTTTGREEDGSLNGLPRKVGRFTAAVNPEIVKVAEAYMESAGMSYNPPENYVPVDPEFAARVGEAYGQMEHNPNDPEVKAAYEQLAKETAAQYQAALDAGLKVEFINYERDGDPYEESPRMVTDDINDNNHIWVFSTRDGFGSDETFDPSENPLLEETEFEISGQKALVNDLFRVVHDYFGHAKEGVGFRANGEENAFRAHSAMFSPQAQRALASETRGQNSWLNFGPHGEDNRTAKTDDTIFADQKTGLMPEWASAVTDDIVLEQSVSLRKGTETLKRFGLDPNKTHNTRDVAAALEARQRKRYGKIEATDNSPEASRKIANWMVEEVLFELENPARSGVGWYSDKFQRALDTFAQEFPELKTDKTARDTFTALIAITSDGQKVKGNFSMAEDIYRNYRDTGEFTTTKGTQRQQSISGNLKVMQDLFEELGSEKVHEYLMEQMTVGELKKIAREAGKEFKSDYKVDVVMPRAALIFGPKLGAFYANLMGADGYLTMDRWWSRTFNRYRGSLLQSVKGTTDKPTDSKGRKIGLARFKELIGEPNISDDEALSKIVIPRNEYKAKGYKNGTPIETAANTIYKIAFENIEDAPYNASDRSFMLEAVGKAAKTLKRKGHDISVADIQAILWYYEKRLYGDLGTRQTADISYEEAAQEIVNARSERPFTQDGLGEDIPIGEEIFNAEEKGKVRGYYEPANSIIRLTEAADLSTFLHEFAHFMYEMEVNGDTEMLQSINGWYKRNAEAVAKEANSYLGEDFDALKQGDVESVEQRKERAREQGFDVDTVYYHGSDKAGFKEFELPVGHKTEGTGIFITDNFNQAKSYQSGRGDIVEIYTGEEIFNDPDLIDDLEIVKQYGIVNDKGTVVSDAYDYNSFEDFQADVKDGEIDESELGSPVELYTIIDPEGYEIVLEGTKEDAIEELNQLENKQPGVIELYVKLNDENTLTIDWQGQNWDESPVQEWALIDSNGDVIDWTYTKEEAESKLESDDDIVEIQAGESRTTDEHAREAREMGYEAIRFLNIVDPGPYSYGGEEGNVTVIFDPKNIRSVKAQFQDPESVELLAQPTDRPIAKEGSITTDDVISFLDNASTGDKAKDAAIRRAVHEQFARGFEQYLMEGKAPSIELRNAFRAFARWLSRIYQSLRGKLDVNLDDQMRQVFDRLLATEEQIQAAEARARVEPLFSDAAMAGMTEEEFAKYQANQEKVKDVQSETLRDKIIKQLTRQTEKWWKEEKQDIVDEEIESLNEQQVYKTRARLKDGDIKIDHATVKEMIGEEKTNKLGRTSVVIPPELRGMTAKGMQGVHPDEAAAFFGYGSGSEMLMDLVTAPTIKVQAETNAQARMIDRHGDILTDGTIEREADEAVQNEERGKLILAELKALAKGTNAPTVDRQTIKALAEERVGKLSFREIHPGKYRKAEIRAAQEAARMLAEGNKEGAAGAKLRQVTNYYLGMAATNAKNETTKIVDRMARYNKKKVREAIMKVEGGYWDQIVKILGRFEFRKAATLKEVESLNTWMAERIGETGDALVLTNAVLNESYVTHWKNVPFSDLQGINDSVKNIEHVARYANKLTRMQEEIDFNKLVDRWVTSMDENVKTRFKSQRTDVAEGRNWGRWFMAQMTKVPFMASWLDGGERAGISHQVMVQPFTDAYNAEIKLWEEAGKPVMDAIESRSKEDTKRHNQKHFIPEIKDENNDGNLYGHQILAVALNTGNQSNLKKMLLGEGWADPDVDTDISFDNPKLQAVLSRMTKSDWEMVQNIWDQMETLYPKLAEVHRRTTGLTPPKIESTEIKFPDRGLETDGMVLRGGYYPVKYDPNRDHRAALNEDKLNAETESMFSNGASIQASVNTGATNERTGYYAPIRLSLDVVPAHFQETIHYITHHDAVREVNRLTRDKRVAQTIKDKLGPEEYAQLRPWLNDIAKDGREAPTKTFIDSTFDRMRLGTTLGIMGFKASTGIIQISGLSNTIAEVGMIPVMQSMRMILGSTTSIKQAWGFAVENSQVLEHRPKTMDREINNAMRKLEGKRGILAAVQETSMKHIALIQTYMVDLPSWHAAYIKGMNEWGDETRAFQYADWVIENVQGSGITKDLAQIMRNQSKTHTTFTMFMTFFSSLWNMERDLVKGAKTGRYSTTNVAAKAMFLFTIPVLFEMMMRGELGEPEDGEDDRLQQMLTKVTMFPVQSVPFMRDAANALTGEFGYNATPVAAVMEKGFEGVSEIVTRGFTDDEITKGQIKGATKFIGATLGIPGTSQAWATGEHLFEVLEEGEELTMHQLLFGPERE